jgi:uncharacterized membrane protein
LVIAARRPAYVRWEQMPPHSNSGQANLSFDSPVYQKRPPREVCLDRTATTIGAAGLYLLAAPMLIYPVLHFIYPDFVASIVPPWIPWRHFWTYFTAVTIFAAGLAIIARKYVYWAAVLLGIEILFFVLLIRVPLLFHSPGNRWAEAKMFGDSPSRVINAFKDFGLCGAVFILAGTQSRAWNLYRRDRLLMTGQSILLISIAAFGLLHFIYPQFAPGIPPMLADIGHPLPGDSLWVYGTAVAFLAMAVAIAANWRTYPLAAVLGALVLAFDLLTWIPNFVVHPMDVTGNWLKDLGIAGGLWVLAKSGYDCGR